MVVRVETTVVVRVETTRLLLTIHRELVSFMIVLIVGLWFVFGDVDVGNGIEEVAFAKLDRETKMAFRLNFE